MEEKLHDELRKLLDLNETERVSRNRCFDRFDTPFGRKLFAYYRTCMSLKKEICDERRRHTVLMADVDNGKEFELKILNEPIRYQRTTVLPLTVKSYFEDLIKNRPNAEAV
ncbi:MAG: hypothetical protein H6684_08485 [Deltaproteobacteria bacterium]|nr:hypothetical protein [Deltaproteobacteria bacterium]MCB9479310.1 hypothetical protein [Deltaproteobacteria bacterium]MCB9488754.1 hypothetical protein [Deltaproteobacteria bacterium]